MSDTSVSDADAFEDAICKMADGGMAVKREMKLADPFSFKTTQTSLSIKLSGGSSHPHQHSHSPFSTTRRGGRGAYC
jgi:hypothetical protein